ncbi:MipA/OmpV family protein [Pantoea sp. S61]|uniref:MipA/OmpV family protein n=1 Tax=Pantoea sp. S61 TaxID=2767442 RepID=UPI00190BE4A6|nr:MipA/OmpV family protein [Pantoea sp. S61]MBK0122563.1 MipA/OmpV family protein [Pantoea sp. S61]MBK0122728.1 MipA/OmpV family protein [Pantoea sp. S61]
MRFTLAQPVTLFCLLSLTSMSALAADDSPEFSGYIGGGVGEKPNYSGAKDNKTEFIPAFRLAYGPLFVGGVDDLVALGWDVLKTEHWTFALGAGTDISPRKESADDHLRGLGDIDVTPRAFTSATYENSWFKGSIIASQDVGGNQQGFKLASYAHLQWHPVDNLRLYTGPTLSWADSDYLQTQYGVTAAQSERSGLSRYTADAGIEKIGWDVGMDYVVTPSWLLGARVTAQRLRDDAADSPVTQQASQLTGVLFLAWRF